MARAISKQEKRFGSIFNLTVHKIETLAEILYSFGKNWGVFGGFLTVEGFLVVYGGNVFLKTMKILA